MMTRKQTRAGLAGGAMVALALGAATGCAGMMGAMGYVPESSVPAPPAPKRDFDAEIRGDTSIANVESTGKGAGILRVNLKNCAIKETSEDGVVLKLECLLPEEAEGEGK